MTRAAEMTLESSKDDANGRDDGLSCVTGHPHLRMFPVTDM